MDGWLLTRYDHVRAGLADPRYSSDPARASERTREAMASTLSRTVSMFAGTMVTTDPPDAHATAQGRIARIRARPGELFRRSCDAGGARAWTRSCDAGGGDLAAALADPLVAAMACELLGVPEEDRADVIAAMNAMVVMPVDDDARRSADDAAAMLQTRFAALLDRDVPASRRIRCACWRPRGATVSSATAETLTTALLLLGSSVINPRGRARLRAGHAARSPGPARGAAS